MVLIISFAIAKFNGLVSHVNPSIIYSTMQNFYSSTDVIDFKILGKNGFKMAFAVEDY